MEIETRSADERIIDEATSWPGVTAQAGSRGELSLRYGRREIGHLHGDRVAHFGFPKAVGAELKAQGRIGPHPVFPDKVAWGARGIASEDDVREVIALLRLNYDRAASRSSV
jgi:Family of unknown function (DUF5519)